MIPKMGRNKIKLGTTENIDDKLYRLKVFYKKAISKYGTDKFSELDLQYEDRVFSKENKS
jgi:cell division protein FtsQ